MPFGILSAPLDSATAMMAGHIEELAEGGERKRGVLTVAAELLDKIGSQETSSSKDEFQKRAEAIRHHLHSDITSEKEPETIAFIIPKTASPQQPPSVSSAAIGQNVSSMSRYFLLVFLIGLISFLAWREKDSLLSLMGTDVVYPGLVLTSQVAVGQTKLPEPELIASMSDLDAVFYDVKRGSDKDSISSDGNQSSASAVSRQREQPRQTTNEPTENKHATIDVSGPIEPEEIRSIVTSDKIDASSPETTPTPTDVNDPFQRRKEPISGVVSPPKFEDFKQPKMYEIISDTSVMRDPSIRSISLANLVIGDKIRVIGREGYWLKVQSKVGGRNGYVLAQDAQPEREW